MAAKGYLVALLKCKCPRCREGDVFTYPLSHIAKFNTMNDTCPHCGIRLEPEPGFYQGAMFVSYALAVGVIIFVWIALYYLLGDPSAWTYITVCTALIVLVVPLNYRYSRILFLYWFGGPRYRHQQVP